MKTQQDNNDLILRLRKEDWLKPEFWKEGWIRLMPVNPISKQDSPQELKRCLLSVVQTCRCNYCGSKNVCAVAEMDALGTRCLSCNGVNVGDFFFFF